MTFNGIRVLVIVGVLLAYLASDASAADGASAKLDIAATTERLSEGLEHLLRKKYPEARVDCNLAKGLVTFQYRRPVEYTVRIPNMVGELQKPRKTPGPAVGGFKGRLHVIAGDTSLYQAVYPQVFSFFYERGKVLFQTYASAPYKPRYDCHVRADISFPGKTCPPLAREFSDFVGQWDKYAVIKGNRSR